MVHRAEPPAVGAGGTADERSTKPDCDTYPAQLRRRREASYRLPVLECGRSDPWYYDPLPLSDNQLDGWVATVVHLEGHGLTAIVPVAVWRALKKRYAA